MRNDIQVLATTFIPSCRGEGRVDPGTFLVTGVNSIARSVEQHDQLLAQFSLVRSVTGISPLPKKAYLQAGAGHAA
ncbi:hypothetical protein [Streptomyces sp. NPDC048057]|uniref:hypothetical protein n=1 Tax=Streptomyces sp. NPDC048057 TaxID=3155628 RepID=UPI0033CD3CB7